MKISNLMKTKKRLKLMISIHGKTMSPGPNLLSLIVSIELKIYRLTKVVKTIKRLWRMSFFKSILVKNAINSSNEKCL